MRMRGDGVARAFLIGAIAVSGHIAGAADGGPKRYPPRGIEIPAGERDSMERGLKDLGAAIEALRGRLRARPAALALLPDVEVFHRAVRLTLEDEMFHRVEEFAAARELLEMGLARAAELRAGKPGWIAQTGLVARGYVSRLDGSVQPYGLVVPESYRAGERKGRRLDLWFHGRGDTLSEVAFLRGRLHARLENEFAPADAFVLHPYGRYMNAYKFAGETDVFEAMAHVAANYPIDPDRICARGFSMGGAAAWHLGAHHASLWAAVNPGAGFVDTWVYLGLEEKSPKPPSYERLLYRLYDAVEIPRNFFNTTLVAYSGEQDKQKAAADRMEAALAAEGMKMTHIIGPKTGHRYEPEAKEEVARLVDAAAARGRDRMPAKVRFVTYTLRYNRMAWVTVDALGRHWEKASVDAEISGRNASATTSNVEGLTLQLPAGVRVLLDGADMGAAAGAGAQGFVRVSGAWRRAAGAGVGAGELRKRHGLQGPIDDAFMEPFLLVAPTGAGLSREGDEWARAELEDARRQWRLQMRGEARERADREVTQADVAGCNLILFGDARSNAVIARVAERLPIGWDQGGAVKAGQGRYPSGTHVPVGIYPNPLNPARYVVLNSGFTFAEVGGGSNANQTPKLPDWAVIDITVPRAERLTRGVVAAGFFGERWECADRQ